MDIQVTPKTDAGPIIKIQDIRPTDFLVSIVGKVTQIIPVHDIINPRNHFTEQVASFTVRDETGEIRFTLWSFVSRLIEQRKVKIGDTIRATKVMVRPNDEGELELILVPPSTIEFNPSDMNLPGINLQSLPEPKKKIITKIETLGYVDDDDKEDIDDDFDNNIDHDDKSKQKEGGGRSSLKRPAINEKSRRSTSMAGIRQAVRGNGVRFRGLTSEGRAYYRDMWGFDPVEDLKEAPPISRLMPAEDPALWGPPFPREAESPALWSDGPSQEPWPDWVYNASTDYYYEADIPLENDPELQAAGVGVRARVNEDKKMRSHNRIVFARGNASAEVECMHTVVYEAPAKEILNLPGEKIEELVTSTEGKPVMLPPWEHFAAMKSYVAGIVSVGILDSIIVIAHDKEEYPSLNLFGLNNEMVTLIWKALYKVAPRAMIARYMKVLGDLCERRPAQWLAHEWVTLVQDFALFEVMAHASYWDALPPPVQEKVREAVQIVNEPAREHHPELFDAGMALLALPNMEILPVSDIYPVGHVIYEKVYDLRNGGSGAVRVHDPPQVLVRAFYYKNKQVDEAIFYREDPGDENRVKIMWGTGLCPKGTRAQIFAQMCMLAGKIASMNGESFRLAAIKYKSIKPHASETSFLNCLAEFDAGATRTILSYFVPTSEKDRDFLKSFEFLNSSQASGVLVPVKQHSQHLDAPKLGDTPPNDFDVHRSKKTGLRRI